MEEENNQLSGQIRRKSKPQIEDELLRKALESMNLTGKKRDIDPESDSPSSEIRIIESEKLQKRPRSNAISE